MRKNNKTKRLEATAYHEAGHAVMHYVLGVAFKHVTIKPEPERHTLGHVKSKRAKFFNPEFNDDSKTRYYAEREAMTLFAGTIAEKKFTGKDNHVGADSDYHQAVYVIGYFASVPKELEAYLNWLQIKAALILTQPQNWRMVEALANALVKDETLSTVKARKIMKEAQYPDLPKLYLDKNGKLCTATM